MSGDKTVFEGKRIVVRDICDELPRHENWPYSHRRSGRYRLIRGRQVDRVYWHHTGGAVRPGLDGPEATARYCVRDPQSGGRGWPGMPYHLFIPYEPETTQAGQLVVYQCQPLDMWTWHTGGKDARGRSRNRHGVGVVCQGRFWSRHRPDDQPLAGQTGWPSAEQMVASEALWQGFLKPTLGLTDAQLRGHFDAGKATCPGEQLQAWVRHVRGGPRD